MNASELLVEAFARLDHLVPSAVRDLSMEQLAFRMGPDANSIAWLIWHLARVQDDHISPLAGIDEAWLAEGWREKFDLPFPPEADGFGMSSAEVGMVRCSSESLTGYFEAVSRRTRHFLAGLSDANLDVVVDERWDPPVTMGARLVSVLEDCLQHAGQAGILRGMLPQT